MSKKMTALLLLIAAVLIGIGLWIGAAALAGIYSSREPAENENPSQTCVIAINPVSPWETGFFIFLTNFMIVTIA